jgi:hypothetical protein
MREAEVGSQPAGTTKFYVRRHFSVEFEREGIYVSR